MFSLPEKSPPKTVWQYQIILREDGQPTHQWSIKDERGGIHIHAWLSQPTASFGTEWMGGIECHWAEPPKDSGWFDKNKPSQRHCWLLGGPCWHDGSSLQFSERVAPYLPYPDGPSPHDMSECHQMVNSVLMSWFQSHIGEFQSVEQPQ